MVGTWQPCCFVGLRTDWLRRAEAMKTAGRENQKRYRNRVASRAPGTEGQNKPARWGGLDGKKNSGHKRSFFSLTPFMELIGRGAGQLPIPVPFRRSERQDARQSGWQFFARVAPFCQKLPEPGETDEFLQALVQMHYLQLAFRSLRRDIQSDNRPQPGAV